MVQDLKNKIDTLARELQELRAALEASEETLPQHTAERQTIRTFSAYLALSKGIEESELLHNLLQCAMYTVNASGAGLTLFEQNRQRLVFKAAIGDGAEGIVGQDVPLQGSIHGMVFATGPIQAATPTYTQIEQATGTAFRNVLVAPLRTREAIIGTISAVNKNHADHFSQEDMQAYQLFADTAATIVQQYLRRTMLMQAVRGQSHDLPADLSNLACGESERLLIEIVHHLVRLGEHEDLLAALHDFLASLSKHLGA